MSATRQLLRVKSGLRLWAAWLCLVMQIGVATPLPAFATALTAWLDGEHRVSLAVCAGELEVVLAHDPTNPRMVPTHQHSALCRMLVSLAPPAGSREADHVIGFAGTATALLDDAVEPATWAAVCEIRLPDQPETQRPLPVTAPCVRRCAADEFTEPIATSSPGLLSWSSDPCGSFRCLASPPARPFVAWHRSIFRPVRPLPLMKHAPTRSVRTAAKDSAAGLGHSNSDT